MLDKSFEIGVAALGAFVLGATYLIGVVLAGLAWEHPTSVKLALASAGVGYATQVLAGLGYPGIASLPWGISAGLGAFSGLLLLWGG